MLLSAVNCIFSIRGIINNPISDQFKTKGNSGPIIFIVMRLMPPKAKFY